MPALVTQAFPSASLATLPQLDFEISLSPPGQGPLWQTVASDVLMESGLSIKRGRSDETQQTNPSTLNLSLKNLGRKFDPDYSGSSLYGYIEPMTRCRLLLRYNNITYIRFDGYMDEWRQLYPGFGKAPQVDCTATDYFQVLARTSLPNSPYAEAVIIDGPNVWYRFDDSGSGTTITDSSGYARHGTYANTAGHGLTFGTGLVGGDRSASVAQTTNVTNSTSMIGVHTVSMASVDCACEFWFSSTATNALVLAAWRNNSVNAVITMNVSGGSGKLVYRKSGVTTRTITNTAYNDGATHHVVLIDTGGTASFVIDGAVAGITTDSSGGATLTGLSDGQVVIANGSYDTNGWTIDGGTPYNDLVGSIDEFALYSPAITSTRAIAHYTAGSAPFSGDLSGARVTRILDSAGIPTAMRDIDTGVATLQAIESYQGEYALDLLLTTDNTERGQMYMGLDGDLSSDSQFKFVFRSRDALTTATRSTVSQGTFGDGVGELRYFDIATDPSGTTFLFNNIQVTRRNGLIQQVSDAASIERYLIRTLPFTNLEFSTDAQSLTLANALLARYKARHTRILSLVIKPQRDPANLWPQVLAREIGDRITAKVTPNGVGAAISRDAIIVGIEDKFSNGEWMTTWRLSEADTL